MSKVKNIISAILAVIVLVGVGFGAYILFGKKDNDNLTEGTIKILRESADELKSAITTVGSTVAGESNSGNASQLSVSSRLSGPSMYGSLTLTTSSTQQDICVKFLDDVKETYANLEMITYALSLSGTKIELGKTYVGEEDGDNIYYGVYRENNNVVFEDDGKKIVVEFNEKDNKPSSISYFDVRRWSDRKFAFEMSTVNFATDKYYYYSGGVKVSSTVTGDDLTNAYNAIEDKIVAGTTLKALKEYVEELGSDFVIGKFQVLTGNITNDAENVNFKFTEYSSVPDGEEIFKNYASDIKNLEYFKYSKTNISKSDAKNLKDIYNDMHAVCTTAKNQYAYNIFDDKFYFYGVNDLKEFDNKVLTKISNELTALGTDNQKYVELKPVFDELFKLYSDDKNDNNYVSVLLCRCDYLQLTSTNGYVENGEFVIEQDASGKIVVNYKLEINITNVSRYDFETQLKEF